MQKKELILSLIGNRKDLVCDFLFERSYEEIKSILELPYWNDEKYSFLLTSNIWKSNAKEIKEILEMRINGDLVWDNPLFAPLLTATIWNTNPSEVKKILEMPEWNEERFINLLTPSVWLSNYENIYTKLHLPFWNNGMYHRLLTPSIFGISVSNIEGNIELFEEYKIEPYIVIRSLRKNPLEQRKFIEYLIDNDIPLVEKNKLNPILNVSKKELMDQFGINYDEVLKNGRDNHKKTN